MVQLVNRILLDAVALGTSDIHLELNSNELEVRLRIDGVMRHHLKISRKVQPFVTTRIKLDISEKRRPQDGRFSIQVNRRSNRDLRVSSVPTPFGEKIVLRILATDLDRLKFEELGVHPEMEPALLAALSATDKMVIVTGPTGSGKSTTLYTAITHLRNGEQTIITVEDPIEYRVDGLAQIQVDSKIGMTFVSGLRSVLRQDPDVIMVGEIRDGETASIALQAAQTGHLVLTTLHTNCALSALIRLLDLGTEPYVLASSLQAVLAQRLVRTLCNSCREPLPDDERNAVAAKLGIAADNLHRPKGCEQCDSKGFRGRKGVYSLLTIDTEMRETIRKNSGERELAAAAEKSGFQPLNESALRIIELGETTVEEVQRVLGALAPRQNGPRRQTERGTKSSAIDDDSIEGGISIAELARGGTAEESAERKPRVLLVDDDHTMRDLLGRVLRKANLEALQRLSQEVPDLVICDLAMPGLNGQAVVIELRKRPQLAHIPVLMLTGNDCERNEIDLLEAGASDFVSKTASPKLVVARVKKLLRAAAATGSGPN